MYLAVEECGESASDDSTAPVTVNLQAMEPLYTLIHLLPHSLYQRSGGLEQETRRDLPEVMELMD